jgi:hypothetical protein
VLGAGGNASGQLGDGTTNPTTTAVLVQGLTLAANDGLLADDDGDGLAGWREIALGTDPLNPDSNWNGLSDGDEAWRASPTHPDPDGDGAPSLLEALWGTDPFIADSDGDSYADGVDAFPLDASRHLSPVPVPGDVTPPVITLTEPTSARPHPPGL